MGTIRIASSLLDREDLDIYAKMCCILLAQAAQEDNTEPLTLRRLAQRMGCTLRAAGAALDQLVERGLLIEEAPLELTELKTEARRVRRKDRNSPAVTFEAFDPEAEAAVPAAQKPALKEQLEVLRSFILEPVKEGTLKILLNMAGGDTARIRRVYGQVKESDAADVMEALMDALQRQDVLMPEPPEPPGHQPKAGTEPSQEALDTETRQVLTQINQKRIAELYMKSKQKR